MGRLSSLLLKGIQRPQDVPGYVKRRTGRQIKQIEYELYRRRHRFSDQRTEIRSFTEDSEFALIVLDACRYDFFERVYNDFLDGELECVWASGRWTSQYVRRTWPDTHSLTYINSAPVISDYYSELNDREYHPSRHIGRLVHLWKTDWDPELGTVPAHSVTDAALREIVSSDQTRLVAHYMQPHAPYVGQEKILPWENAPDEVNGMERLYEGDSKKPTYRILRRIRENEITDEQLRRAYRANLEYVLAEVVRLVRHLDCPTVITADHGEHLGEDGRYLHESDSKLIRQVPWCRVSESELGRADPAAEIKQTERSEATPEESTVRDRLQQLGYVVE